MRDLDSFLEEHLTDEQLAEARGASGGTWGHVVPCDECEGTGVVSEQRRLDIAAVARASVEQAIARAAEEGLL